MNSFENLIDIFHVFENKSPTKNIRKIANEGISPHELTTSAQISWKTISPGGTIMNAGNAEEFNTGDWRSYKPLFIKENCKQCLLCYPACPDSSIPINEQGERGEFDYKHCKGCGVCENVCPFNAIEMKENS